ncbi:MAG: hypothetical protein PHR32_00430 [Candidatus Cloacimonetes bacterium]|nr:hypothetical protein [Candidatus Cloacimonadota bacterium]
MKKGILILVSLLFVVAAFAFDQGTINLGGTVAFESVKANSDADAITVFTVNPIVGYFVMDNISADLNLALVSYDGDLDFGIGIGARYFYNNFYGGLEFDYVSETWGDDTVSSMYLVPKLGYMMPLAENVFVDMGLKYKMGFGDYGGDGSGSNEYSQVHFGVGLQVFLADLFN